VRSASGHVNRIGSSSKYALGLVAAIAGLSACSSSSGGTIADSGANQDAADDSGICMPPADASVATFQAPDAALGSVAASGTTCWSCIQGGCTAQITACSQDCTCNATVLTGAQCLTGDAGNLINCLLPLVAGSGITGFLGGGGSGINSSLMNLGSCTMAAGCLEVCGGGLIPSLDGGPNDGGPNDSGAGDSGSMDGGAGDSGSGSNDGGAGDSGAIDGGNGP
jgi:hypothetical protein